MSAFLTLFHFVCDGWQNRAVCLCIKFRNPEMLHEYFGEHSLSRTAIFEWHSHFKDGRVLFEDDERSGQPSTSKTTENVEKIENSSMKTVAEQSMSSQTPLGSVMEILTENLNMHRTAAKFIPQLLTDDQMQQRVNMYLELRVREKANENPAFISRIITGEESWIYGYDPETKKHSLQWKGPQSRRGGGEMGNLGSQD
jgi:hypothetical protein